MTLPELPKPDMGQSWRKNPGPPPALITAIEELAIKAFESGQGLGFFGRKPRTLDNKGKV